MSRRGLQPLGVVVSFFGILKPLHLLSPRKQFTERIIHYQTRMRGGWIVGGTEAYTPRRRTGKRGGGAKGGKWKRGRRVSGEA